MDMHVCMHIDLDTDLDVHSFAYRYVCMQIDKKICKHTHAFI